jgi:formiminoglutamase
VVLGGDNSITYGAARGAGADGLITFDAHHDCRDPARGPTNGTPVRQLIEGGLGRVVQVGIHGFANAEPLARWAREHGVSWFAPSEVRALGIDAVVLEAVARLEGAGRIWVDVDLDSLDRAFAPGAPGAMPGGLWPADLERAAYLLGRDRHVAGLDVVECDPTADVADVTVRAGCAVLLAFLAGVASR